MISARKARIAESVRKERGLSVKTKRRVPVLLLSASRCRGCVSQSRGLRLFLFEKRLYFLVPLRQLPFRRQPMLDVVTIFAAPLEVYLIRTRFNLFV